MKLVIRLPKMTGFDIALDNDFIHSAYENTKQDVFLNKGEHCITIIDQAPTPSFWHKIFKFLNPLSETVENFSVQKEFALKEDATIALEIIYGDVSFVEIEPDDLLTKIILEENE